MRKKIVAGNWKMNLTRAESESLLNDVSNAIDHMNCDVYQFPPAIYLTDLVDQSVDSVKIGAQNGFSEPKGAFTGEVSMFQLKNIKVSAVLIGHSERRLLFGESHELLKEKVDAAIHEKLTVFFCCGETLDQREENRHEQVVVNQLKESLLHLSADQFKNVVIAYEPVWAIGTGKTASSEQANEMHRTIRKTIEANYNLDIANNTSILYGGSCKPDNAKELFSKEHIDGGLIGGASLKAKDFVDLINTYS